MMRRMRTTLILLLMLLPLLAAHAQTEVSADEERMQRYTVEMIIFKYAQDVSTGGEIFPPDAALASRLPIAEQSTPETDPELATPSLEDEAPRILRDIELVMLARDKFTMNDIKRRLDLLDAYEPLMHFGWTQATWPEEQTRPLNLGAMGRVPTGLDGQLTLYLSRFLHLVVDLQLDAPDTAGNDLRSASSAPSYRDERLRPLDGEPGATAAHYRIDENRIFRNGELRYFDHPKFGVLAKVSRVEAAAEKSETDQASAALPAR